MPQLQDSVPVNVSRSSRPATEARIAINKQNEIMAVWVETSGSWKQVHFALRRQGTWSAPAAIPGQSQYNVFPDVSRGRDRGFVVVWHDVASGDCVRISEFDGENWTNPAQISQNGGYHIGSPRVLSNDQRTIVVWERGNPIWRDIYANIWESSTLRWQGIRQVSFRPNTAAAVSQLAASPDGRFYVVWQGAYDLNEIDEAIEIFLNNDDNHGAWSGETMLTHYEKLHRPTISINRNHDILVTLFYFHRQHYSCIIRRGNTWTSLQNIGSGGHEHERYYSASQSYGDGFVFAYRDQGYNVVYSIYHNSAWTSPRIVSAGRNNYHPALAYRYGTGIAVAWTNRDQNYDVWVRVFDDDQVKPEPDVVEVAAPLQVHAENLRHDYLGRNLKVERIVDRNLFTVRYISRLTWEADSFAAEKRLAIHKYRILRRPAASNEFSLLAELPADRLSYLDSNGISADSEYEYLVRGVDEFDLDHYLFNRIWWNENPENAENDIAIAHYRVFRRPQGATAASFELIRQLGASDFSWEDHDFQIRTGQSFLYGVSSMADDQRESEVSEAVITTAKKKPR